MKDEELIKELEDTIREDLLKISDLKIELKDRLHAVECNERLLQEILITGEK